MTILYHCDNCTKGKVENNNNIIWGEWHLNITPRSLGVWPLWVMVIDFEAWKCSINADTSPYTDTYCTDSAEHSNYTLVLLSAVMKPDRIILPYSRNQCDFLTLQWILLGNLTNPMLDWSNIWKSCPLMVDVTRFLKRNNTFQIDLIKNKNWSNLGRYFILCQTYTWEIGSREACIICK